MSIKLVAALCLVVGLAAAERETFDNYRVYRMNVDTEQQLLELRQLEYSGYPGIQFWKSPSCLGGKSDIMVAPHQMATFAELIEKLNLSGRVMIENVQSLIDNEQPKTRSSVLDWTSYWSFDEINQFLDEQMLAYPTLLTDLTVGTSYQNRTIRAIRLSHKEGNPTIFIESNIHAREWITSATATWLLHTLLTSTDVDVQDLAQNIDWVMIPVVNVDGFVYSHTTNRVWRKTRQPHSTLCYGADPNRNFDHQWMVAGASGDVCSDLFAGPHALSEPEARAMVDFTTSYPKPIDFYIAFHSAGQLLMFPWGYTDDKVENHDRFMTIAEKTKEAIAVRYGTEYKVGPLSTTIYPSSGSTIDWVYGILNVKSVFAFEFRDNGTYGHILPANQIVPNAEEVLDGLIAFVKENREHNLL